MKTYLIWILLLLYLTGCANNRPAESYVPSYVDEVLAECGFEEICPVEPEDVVKIELRVSSNLTNWIYYYEEADDVEEILAWLGTQNYQEISYLRARYMRNHESRDGDPSYYLVLYTNDTAVVLEVSYLYLQVDDTYYLSEDLWAYMEKLEKWNVPNEEYDWRTRGPIEEIFHSAKDDLRSSL